VLCAYVFYIAYNVTGSCQQLTLNVKKTLLKYVYSQYFTHFQHETAIRYRTSLINVFKVFTKEKQYFCMLQQQLCTFVHWWLYRQISLCYLSTAPICILCSFLHATEHCHNDKLAWLTYCHTSNQLKFLYCPKSKPEMHYGDSSASHCKCCLHSTHGKFGSIVQMA